MQPPGIPSSLIALPLDNFRSFLYLTLFLAQQNGFRDRTGLDGPATTSKDKLLPIRAPVECSAPLPGDERVCVNY